MHAEKNHNDCADVSKMQKPEQLKGYDVYNYVTKQTKQFSETLEHDTMWFTDSLTKIHNYLKIRKLNLLTFKDYARQFVKIIQTIDVETSRDITKDAIIDCLCKNHKINRLRHILQIVNVLIALKIFNNVDSTLKISKEDVMRKKKSTIMISMSNIKNTNIVGDDNVNDGNINDDDINDDINDDCNGDDLNQNILDAVHKGRNYFTEDEIINIVCEAEKNKKNNLMIALLLYNGFGIGGLINIRMENIYDYHSGMLKYDGKTLEKKNQYRYFPISRNEKLVEAFNDYFEARPDILDKRGFLFPRKDSYEKHVSPGSILRIIKTICKKCNICDNLANARTFVRTVIVRLLRAGNNLDKIAAFIGYKSATKTFKNNWNPSCVDTLPNKLMHCIENNECQ